MNESHLHCHLFLHTILSFPSFFNCLISPTPCIVKAGCVLSVLAMAGPGPISRHYALSAAPDTSKMGTFPSAPPLAPAKMWIQLLNTGIGISNERQLGGAPFIRGENICEEPPKNENHFLLSLPFIVKIINNFKPCNLYLHSITIFQVGGDIPSLLQMSISRDTRHGPTEVLRSRMKGCLH